jgi:hypothetical protein
VKDHHTDCGCFLGDSSITVSYLFVSTRDGKQAWMNINGEEISLILNSSTRPTNLNSGSVFSEYYSCKDVLVSLDYTVINAHEINTGYDWFEIKAILTINKNKCVQVFRVHGEITC